MDKGFSQPVIIFPAFIILRRKLFTLSLKQTVRVTYTHSVNILPLLHTALRRVPPATLMQGSRIEKQLPCVLIASGANDQTPEPNQHQEERTDPRRATDPLCPHVASAIYTQFRRARERHVKRAVGAVGLIIVPGWEGLESGPEWHTLSEQELSKSLKIQPRKMAASRLHSQKDKNQAVELSMVLTNREGGTCGAVHCTERWGGGSDPQSSVHGKNWSMKRSVLLKFIPSALAAFAFKRWEHFHSRCMLLEVKVISRLCCTDKRNEYIHSASHTKLPFFCTRDGGPKRKVLRFWATLFHAEVNVKVRCYAEPHRI